MGASGTGLTAPNSCNARGRAPCVGASWPGDDDRDRESPVGPNLRSSLRKGSASDGANQSAADGLDDVGRSARSRGEALRENRDLDVVAHEHPEVDERADPRVDAEVRDGHGRTRVGLEVLLAPFAEARRERGIRSHQANVDRAIGAARLVDAEVARRRLITARLPGGADARFYRFNLGLHIVPALGTRRIASLIQTASQLHPGRRPPPLEMTVGD